MSNIRDNYYWWMITRIFHNADLIQSYNPLLSYLDSIPYQWSLDMDENRQKDAQDLRYTFGEECGYSEVQICQDLDIIEPSLLEVIVALINRAQENILFDPEQQYNLNQEIFIDILTNLGIEEYRGELDDFAIAQIDARINDFFNRNYSYYGEGGMFVVNQPKSDMRTTEMWYQFMWYLNEKLGGKYL